MGPPTTRIIRINNSYYRINNRIYGINITYEWYRRSRGTCSIIPGYLIQLQYTRNVIESVDSISRDEPDSPLTQYITNAGISPARYTITHFKHHHRVLWLISNRKSVCITSL